MANGAPSADDLLTRMNAISPPASSPSGGQSSAPEPVASAARPSQSSAPSSDDLLTRMNAISPPAEQTTTAVQTPGGPLPYAPPAGTGARNIANALIGGIYSVGANVASNLGITPNPLPADVQSAMAAHPVFRTAGELVGGTAVGLPIGVGLGVAAPVVGLGADLGGAIATGGAAGAAQNVLTGDPNQSWYQRAGTGALEGAVLGGVTHKVFDWLGPQIAAATSRQAPGEAPPLPTSATTNLLAPELQQRVAAGPAAGPTSATGVAQPAGAQITPGATAGMTPEEIATQRTVADKQWLNQTQQPGITDTTEHIPGITTNLVEQEQTVQRARELKALKNLNPALSQNEREILDVNNNIRQGYYADTVGSEVTRAADLKAANDKINTDLAQVWRGKGEADPANVVAQIDKELAGSAGELPPLKSAMNQVSDSLANAGGDPEAMYRTHRLINYLQSRQGQIANPGYGAADVQAALTRVKGTLAATIEDAAPGFSKAMSDYARARGPIEAARALQERENGLYDGQGRMQFLPVHRLARDIIEAQKWDAPNNPLAGVSDAQMARIKALHDDLKRVASAKDLAAAAGSDTAMNAADIAREYARGIGGMAVHGAANLALGPGVGSMAVRGLRGALNPLLSARAGRQQMQRGMEILRPGGNPLNQ